MESLIEWEPPRVLDAARAAEQTRAALADVERRTEAQTASRISAAIARLCGQRDFWTTDDLWEELGAQPDHAFGSAMGPLIMRALRAGLMRTDGTRVRSQRPTQHGKQIPVYESLRVVA